MAFKRLNKNNFWVLLLNKEIFRYEMEIFVSLSEKGYRKFFF